MFKCNYPVLKDILTEGQFWSEIYFVSTFIDHNAIHFWPVVEPLPHCLELSQLLAYPAPGTYLLSNQNKDKPRDKVSNELTKKYTWQAHLICFSTANDVVNSNCSNLACNLMKLVTVCVLSVAASRKLSHSDTEITFLNLDFACCSPVIEETPQITISIKPSLQFMLNLSYLVICCTVAALQMIHFMWIFVISHEQAEA
jgi:hypothetical protein